YGFATMQRSSHDSKPPQRNQSRWYVTCDLYAQVPTVDVGDVPPGMPPSSQLLPINADQLDEVFEIGDERAVEAGHANPWFADVLTGKHHRQALAAVPPPVAPQPHLPGRLGDAAASPLERARQSRNRLEVRLGDQRACGEAHHTFGDRLDIVVRLELDATQA